MLKRAIPMVIAISLLTGCSLTGKINGLFTDAKKSISQETLISQELNKQQAAEVQPVPQSKTEVQPAKAQEKPKPAPSNTTTTKKQTTTTTQPKTTTPPPPPAQPVVNNGRPDIPTNYSFEYLKAIEDEIAVLVNRERAKEGLGSLAVNETLRLSARYKSNEMLQYNYFEHKSPVTGFDPWDIAKTFNYKYTAFGENLYMVQGLTKAQVEAAKIVDAWMNSPGHRANILNKNFGKIGVGVVFSSKNNKTEATQHFSN